MTFGTSVFMKDSFENQILEFKMKTCKHLQFIQDIFKGFVLFHFLSNCIRERHGPSLKAKIYKIFIEFT